MTLADQGVSRLALFGHWLAFAAADAGQPNRDTHIVALDRRDGRRRVVARTRWRHGQMDWVVGSGDTAIWTDMSRTPDDGDPTASWTLYAQALRSATARVLARSTKPEEATPTPHACPGAVVWSQLTPDGGSNVYRLNVNSGQVRRVVHLTVDSQVACSRGWTFYNAPSRNGHGGVDVWGVHASGGSPVQISESEQAVLPVGGGDDLVAWQEPEQGSPERLVVAHADTPADAHSWSPGEANEVIGDDFLAWLDGNGGVQAAPLTGGDSVNVTGSPIAVSARLSADANLLAYAIKKGRQTQVVLARLRAQ